METNDVNEVKNEPDAKEASVDPAGRVKNPSLTGKPPSGKKREIVSPQVGEGACPGCASAAESDTNGNETASFVYALGRVEMRFPSLAMEKEFAQATGRAEAAGLTDREVIHKVITQPQNRYLSRQLCYVLTIEGIETYILQPRNPMDFDMLVEAVRPAPRLTDVDIVIGIRGPMAPPEMCNGLVVPIVVFDQIYSFDIDSLIKSIPRPKEIPAKEFTATAEELFTKVMQLADNAGATDEHRAMNYLAVRYPKVYELVAERFAQNCSLTGVEVRPSRLSGVRKIVDVIGSFTHRQTDVIDKYFVRVDVTEEFPFLVTKLSPYYDKG